MNPAGSPGALRRDLAEPGSGRSGRGCEPVTGSEPVPGFAGGQVVALQPTEATTSSGPALRPSGLAAGAGAPAAVRLLRRPAPRRGARRRGAALILTLLVLAILVVLTVQLSYSVKVEETIVRNTEDDAAMELAAVRGAIALVGALFRDDRKNGVPAGEQDTLADIWCDPAAQEQRRFTLGDVELTLEIEDLERRLPLAWLADPQRKDLAEVALRRLLERLQVEGDAAAIAAQIAERVRQLEGVPSGGPDGAAPAAPQPAAPQPADPAGQPPRPRRFIGIEQLLDGAPAGGAGTGTPAAGMGGAPGGGAPGGSGAAAAALDRRILYGDPEADPPRSGLAPFVTTWPVARVNINTVLPEVLFALLPEKNKADEPLWEDADAIVEAIRGRRIDPAFQQGGGAGGTGQPGGQPAPSQPGGQPGAEGGGQGASQQWSGTAFTNVDELQSADIHPKLAKLFTNEGGGQPGGGQSGQEEVGFKDLLAVKSRSYMVRARARRGQDSGSVEAVYRLMIWRGADDEAVALYVAEAGAR